MAKTKSIRYQPASLLQLFEPPGDDFNGVHGWLCTYSADDICLNQGLDAFCGKNKSARASEAVVRLVLMADESNPQVTPALVPGLHHAGRFSKVPPFALMHAKVALLLFRSKVNEKKIVIRLIVSTGNFVQATLSKTLDVAVKIDYRPGGGLESGQDKLARADIVAAWQFMKYCREHYPHDIFNSDYWQGLKREKREIYDEYIQVLESIRRPRNIKPRFFDNRQESLLSQITEIIVANQQNQSARNCLCLGSGFFQSGRINGKIPSVFTSLETQLRKKQLLTAQCEKLIFVNPKKCQSVSRSIEELQDAGWEIRSGKDPLNRRRELHAKFIFSFFSKTNSNFCNNAWLYVGSGNLTEQGFLRKAQAGRGNLEAGIILFPEKFMWRNAERNLESDIKMRLPIHWDEEVVSPGDLLYGEDFSAMPQRFVMPPVSLFQWVEENGQKRLKLLAEPGEPFKVFGPDGKLCSKDKNGEYIWEYQQPAEVMVKWGDTDQFHAYVPVMDNFGRLAGKDLRDTTIEEAMWQLAKFPNTYEDDEDDVPEDSGSDETQMLPVIKVTKKNSEVYPIRRMMMFIEEIAVKQAGMQKGLWRSWCSQLKQVMVSSKKDPAFDTFRRLGINPFSALYEPSFRPEFAEDNTTEEGKSYEDALAFVIREVGLDQFKFI